MKKKKEQGYAIIILLVLASVLMLSLSTAIFTLCELRRQNMKAKKELQQSSLKNNNDH
jgi:flagellar basal body-associated protein FliL